MLNYFILFAYMLNYFFSFLLLWLPYAAHTCCIAFLCVSSELRLGSGMWLLYLTPNFSLCSAKNGARYFEVHP